MEVKHRYKTDTKDKYNRKNCKIMKNKNKQNCKIMKNKNKKQLQNFELLTVIFRTLILKTY